MINSRFLQRVLISLTLFSGGAFSVAEAQIYLDKGKYEVNVEPGQYLAEKVVVTNSTDQKRKIKVYMEDYEYIAPYDGQKNFHKAGLLPNSDSNWVSLSNRELDIEPHGQAIVTFTINVPDGIKGGYYGALIFENVPLEQVNPSGTGIALITRIGMMINLEANGFGEEIGLDDFKFEDGSLKFVLSNLGQIHAKPDGKFYAMSQDGDVADRGDIRKYFLPVGAKGDVVIPIKPDLAVGKYTLVLTMNLRNGDSIIREIDFEKAAGDVLKMLEVRN